MAEINHPRRRQRRQHRFEVRLSDAEVATLKNANASSIARLMRESALAVAVGEPTSQRNRYSQLDRQFLLELSRIGNNVNQIAKAINTDIASFRPLDAARLLHLLIAINENLRSLKKEPENDH